MKKNILTLILNSWCFIGTVSGLDVVIPAAPKDQATLDLAISCIRSNMKFIVDKIYVISPHKISSKADWFPESNFPFNLNDLNRILTDQVKADPLVSKDRAGWYLQQLLKLYAGKIIPNLSRDYLVVDADTLIFRDLELYRDRMPCYATGEERHDPYFQHMARLLPGLKKIEPRSGIVHHMLFQQQVLDDLFEEVEEFWGQPFWQAFLLSVDPQTAHSGASEYEIYFNYLALRKIPRVIRDLRWKNEPKLRIWRADSREGWDFVSYHAYMRS
jgi:hypothetical protein